MVEVKIIMGEDRRKAARQAVEAVGHDILLPCRNADEVVIMPDLALHDGPFGVTHLETLRGILDVVRQYTEAPIVVGAAAKRGTEAMMRQLGYVDIVRWYKNVSLLDWTVEAMREESLLREDGVMMTVRRPQFRPNSVTIGCGSIKTGGMLDFSAGITSWALGSWIVPSRAAGGERHWNREPWLVSADPVVRQAMVADLYAAMPCTAIVLDGMLIMAEDGSGQLRPEPLGVTLAGTDVVAVDTVAATLAGYDAHSIPYLERLAMKGVGTNEIVKCGVPLGELQSLMRT